MSIPISKQREESQEKALRIQGEGQFPVESVTKFLKSLEYAYNSAYVLDSLVDQASELVQSDTTLPVKSLLWMSWWPPTPEKVAAMVPEADRLILKGVELHSPGWWDVFGKLNPLETIREYLNDRHQRQLDWKYRAPAEARNLELENNAIELKNIQIKVEILRSAGVPQQDIAVFVEQLISPPLRELGGYQDQRLLSDAEVVDLGSVKQSSMWRRG